MKPHDEMSNFLYFYGDVRRKIGAFIVAQLATDQKISELYEVDWLDPDASRFENKSRMKEQAVSIWGYEDFLKEMSIIFLAKIVEDVFVELEKRQGVKIDIWANPFPYKTAGLEKAKEIRQLNNVIKHNRGVIEKGKSHAHDFLIELGHKDGSEMRRLEIDIFNAAEEIYYFLTGLIAEVTKFKFEVKNRKTKKDFLSTFVPEAMLKAIIK